MKLDKGFYIRIFKLIVTILMGYLLYKVVSVGDLLESLSRFKFLTLFLISVNYFVGIYISVLRWRIFLPESIDDQRKRHLYKSYVIGAFVNNFLPSSFGGDISKLYTVKGDKTDIAKSVVFERLSGIIVAIILAAIASLFITEQSSLISSGKLILYVGSLISIVLLILLKYPGLQIAQKFVPKLFTRNRRIASMIEKFTTLQPIKFYKSLPFSAMYYSLSIISFMLYLGNLGYYLNPLQLAFMITTVTLISMIPISFNALGLKEVSYVAILGVFGVASSDALAIAIVSRVLLILFSLIGGIILLLERKER